jgi:parvulin-like peptidyl-prolyl isomerase
MNVSVFSPKTVSSSFDLPIFDLPALEPPIFDPSPLELPALDLLPFEFPALDPPTFNLAALVRKYQLIPQILQCTVIDRAIASIAVTAAERELALDQFYQQHQLSSPNVIATWLQINHLSQGEIESVALRPIRIEKFKLKTWGDQLESYFLARKDSLDKVIYSLIRVQSEEIAQELYYRLQNNEQSFAELSHQFSEGAESQTGGKIGPVPLSQPHPDIRHLLTVSQAGQLWSPRHIDEWFVIVRLEHLEPVHFDAAIKQYLLNELFETWVKAEVAQQSQAMLQSLGVA